MLAKFIEQMRKKNGFTQEQLAAELGISRPTYVAIARGARDLTLTEADILARLFGLTLDNLLHERELKIELKVTGKSKSQDVATCLRINVPQEKLDKFKAILLYILKKIGGKPNIGMTALYKIIYFIDFDYYELYEEQIMGLRYIKNHFGPTPIGFDKVVDEMIANNQIECIKSKYYQHQQKKFLINPEIDPDLHLLSAQEIKHIDAELRRLSGMNASALSDLSHKDVPWITAEEGQMLEYETVFYRTAVTSLREYPDGDET